MTPSELIAFYDVKRTLERIKDYCENRSKNYDDREYEQWKYVASEANTGLVILRILRDIERRQ